VFRSSAASSPAQALVNAQISIESQLPGRPQNPSPAPVCGARREERETRELAADVLSFFGQRLAGYRWDQPAYSLSYANRRRLEIARALAARPRLLLLDEPAAGMNPAETHEITELIARLCTERDLAILVIEHDMHVVASCSDRVVALDHGVKIAEGGFDAIANHPAVVEAYLGRDPEALSDAG
jgi:branched-chain amino acid transport system ATP-binding protein